MQQVRLARWATVLVFCIGLVAPGAGSAKEADAGAFLIWLSREASAKLGNVDLTEAQKEENFRRLFGDAFDLPAISRFVLGRYWRDASEAQRQDFMAAFEELQMQRFLPQFAKYDDKTIKVDSIQADAASPDVYKVSSRISRPEGEPIAVVWRIRDAGESYKILDIVAEGVSMAISLRHEYAEVAKAKGVDGLIKDMRDKSAQLAAE
jgi:phospholipid transport system substrate-binding protein